MTEQRVVCKTSIHEVMDTIQTHLDEGWLVHTMVESNYAVTAMIIIVFQREKPAPTGE